MQITKFILVVQEVHNLGIEKWQVNFSLRMTIYIHSNCHKIKCVLTFNEQIRMLGTHRVTLVVFTTMSSPHFYLISE